ncbi:MAG: 3-keto-disaccharide hydrolase, partial [Akkermansiaceae bacterium]
PRVARQSPTLGAEAPKGSTILFDGSSVEHWQNGQMKDGLLQATGTTSKPTFKDYKLHLEFRTPYKPFARGQGRGNSGVYFGGRWETQVLDSFALEGKMNECGGIYSISEPDVNACLPPLVWQTYDVDFTAAKFDKDGNRKAWPRMTVKLNGVTIHKDRELPKDNTTAAPGKGALKDESLPVFLQNHGNPVVFRNIWVLPKKK